MDMDMDMDMGIKLGIPYTTFIGKGMGLVWLRVKTIPPPIAIEEEQKRLGRGKLQRPG